MSAAETEARLQAAIAHHECMAADDAKTLALPRGHAHFTPGPGRHWRETPSRAEYKANIAFHERMVSAYRAKLAALTIPAEGRS